MKLKQCVLCGNEFNKRLTESIPEYQKRRFCSKSCSAKVNNVKYPKKKLSGKCQICKATILVRYKYCDKCKQKIMENM